MAQLENIDVVDYVSSLLDSEKYKEALSVAVEEKYINSFKDNCWDLISIIVSKIDNNTMTIKPSLYGTCEELLAIIVQTATPEEALLEFIEQIEVAKNDSQFSIILQPLQQLLLKLPQKRGRSLEWCLNSISTYIEAIPVKEHQLEGKERLLMDCDNNIRRVIKVYTLLPPFYSPFIREVTMQDTNLKTKEIISAFLISLLGKPLLYVDLDPETNKNSEARSCIDIVVKDICTLVKNVYIFLPYVELHHRENMKTKSKNTLMDNEEEISPYDHKEKINLTTLSGLFYVILSKHFEIPESAIPLVYSNNYVCHTGLLCVNHLLNFAEYGPLTKGISLLKIMLTYLPNSSSESLLSLPVHYNLCKCLINISIYSSYESIRKESVKLIREHIYKFDYKGRSLLIKHMLQFSNHSGMIGYAITLYKNSLDEAFNKPELPECFTGLQLMGMIEKMCHLPHGAESDLVELADQIISSLNFLRYLVIKDTTNKTGIKEQFLTIDRDYLDVLRMGLNMSKAHYEVKLKDIKEESNKKPENQVEISLNVGGNVLDKIPTENKEQIIYSALNAFHLIEGLVARLSECVAMSK